MTIVGQLKRDEGLRLTVYKDTQGIATIGYGHNLVAHEQHLSSCTLAQAEDWLEQDIATAAIELHLHLPWESQIDDARHGVLLNMSFNMGIETLMKFTNTLAAVRRGDWKDAARRMKASRWAKQVGDRAVRLEQQMLTGEWV